jgi:hypothetical protein
MSLQFLRQRSKHALDRFKVRDLGLTAEGLEAWGKTDFGRYLRHHEYRVLSLNASRSCSRPEIT